jgi:hypothetical protein
METGSPKIADFPVKFPVSREFAGRQVRSALRGQPVFRVSEKFFLRGQKGPPIAGCLIVESLEPYLLNLPTKAPGSLLPNPGGFAQATGVVETLADFSHGPVVLIHTQEFQFQKNQKTTSVVESYKTTYGHKVVVLMSVVEGRAENICST